MAPILAETPGPYFEKADERVKKMVDTFEWKTKERRPFSHWLRQIHGETKQYLADQNLKHGRELVMNFLAPPLSDKMRDMEALGIHHMDIDSEDKRVVRNYIKKVKDFHTKYGWLYDFEGRFWGADDQRPVQPASSKETL
jgi:hypothetical protein